MYNYSIFDEPYVGLAQDVLDFLLERKWKLAVAESCTGGLITALLTDIAGMSGALERGFITYTNEAKRDMLDVPQTLLDSVGAVSPEVSIAMAEGAIKHSSADIAVSVTGIAGPDGGTARKPVGTVCMALARRGQNTIQDSQHFHGTRLDVRLQSVRHVLEMILALRESA